MWLNEIYKVQVGKHLSGTNYIYYSKWSETSSCFISSSLQYAIQKVQGNLEDGN
jgi:hypothetical protein